MAGDKWKKLILSSPGYKTYPLGNPKGVPKKLEKAKSKVVGERACIYAARTFGKGRIVVNAGESTISFFGFGYSPYADKIWGQVGMKAGLDGVPSDGLKLFVNSLRWVAKPSMSMAEFGGYEVLDTGPTKAAKAREVKWTEPEAVKHRHSYKKGVIGVIPAIGGGSGSVGQYVNKAKQMGLDYIVFAGYFEKMSKKKWKQLVKDCEKYSDDKFLAHVALITQDEQDNSFIQCGPQSWPKKARLSPEKPKRVRHHLDYGIKDTNGPFRAPFNFSKGKYPGWLFSNFDSYAVRTYRNGKLIDEDFEGFLSQGEQGSRPRVVTVNLVTSPGALAKVTDFTYMLANSIEQLKQRFIQKQFSASSMSYVSNGPKIDVSHVWRGFRTTYGEQYVPGHERWRFSMMVSSDVGLKKVTLYDRTKKWREFYPKGKKAMQINLDGLHNQRRVITVVVEDTKGRRAISCPYLTESDLHRQYFCGDRCNIMGGQSKIRREDGTLLIIPSSTQLYRAGRLFCGTVGPSEELPGIDGSGAGAQLFLYPKFTIDGEGDGKELNPPVHKITRPYDSGDLILFDTPILKRSTAPGHLVFGHSPYVPLVEPKVAARMRQYHFYRNPPYPSPALVDLEMEITAPKGLQLKNGWRNFSVRYTDTFQLPVKRYVILKKDGRKITGPTADNKPFIGSLAQGDSVFFPDLEEGFYILDGKFDVFIDLNPEKKWFRMYTGRFDTPFLKNGEKLAVRLLVLKVPPLKNEAEALAYWQKFQNDYGIGGKSPAYKVDVQQGKVTKIDYLLQLAAQNDGFCGKIILEKGKKLPQRLPIEITGLNPKWTAAKVSMSREEWIPLGVMDNGVAYTTVDTGKEDVDLYIGNLVKADNKSVYVTFFPVSGTAPARIEVHNPTKKKITATVEVLAETWLAGKSRHQVTVEPGTTEKISLGKNLTMTRSRR